MDDIGPVAPDPRIESVVDALERELMELVLAGQFAPGFRLKESVIARDYGAARHTVRAALARLEGFGILVHEGNRGWLVPDIDRAAYEDIIFLRSALEVSAIIELIRRAELPNRAVEEALTALLNAEESDLPRRLELDFALHRAIVDQVESPRMSTAYGDLLMQLRLCRVQSRSWTTEVINFAEWKAHHSELVRVIREADLAGVPEIESFLSSTPWTKRRCPRSGCQDTRPEPHIEDQPPFLRVGSV
jgi:DNA-binding GntR family transcriptional regulator